MLIIPNVSPRRNTMNQFVDNVVTKRTAQKIHLGKVFLTLYTIWPIILGGNLPAVKNGLILIHHIQHKHQPIRSQPIKNQLIRLPLTITKPQLTIIKLLLIPIKPLLITIKHQRRKRALILHRLIRNKSLTACDHIYKIVVRVEMFAKWAKIQCSLLGKQSTFVYLFLLHEHCLHPIEAKLMKTQSSHLDNNHEPI